MTKYGMRRKKLSCGKGLGLVRFRFQDLEICPTELTAVGRRAEKGDGWGSSIPATQHCFLSPAGLATAAQDGHLRSGTDATRQTFLIFWQTKFLKFFENFG